MAQIFTIIIIATAIWYTLRIRKQARLGQIADNVSSGEKVYIWASSFLNPVISGAIFYYGWRKLLPNKAKQANHISMYAFLIELIMAAVIFFLLR